jgi:hypothetical protein
MMPTFGFETLNLSPLINAWTAHYTAKGCSERKAREVAVARAWRKRSWPPA